MPRIAFLLAFVLGISLPAMAGPLHDAARDGDLAAVEAALAQGAEIDAQGDNGETPLILAILAGNDAVAQFMIDEGAGIQGRNAGGFTPLHAAAYAGDAVIAQVLIAKGADINDAQNKAGVTPLFPAIEEDHKAVAELLIAKGASLSSKERHGYTPLTRALFKGSQRHRDLAEGARRRMPVARRAGRFPSSGMPRHGQMRTSSKHRDSLPGRSAGDD